MTYIHSHKILTKVKIPGHAWDQQMAWVRGYILALEDVLDDMGQLNQVSREKVTETLEQAQRTLFTMERMEDEAPHSAEPSTAPAATDTEDQGRVPG